MAEQYWVGDFFVDVTRNQITKKEQSKTIPPKALAVLTCLAKNANNVVSHDELLSEVWPETIVTPNTLQRSIAQLRKALGENSPSYIKTHAKQGYSLEVEVKWQGQFDEVITENTVRSESTEATSLNTVTSATSAQSSRTSLSLIAAVTGMIILAYIAFTVLKTTPSFTLDIVEFNTLTATDNKEYAGIYTPDGEYVVFQRYSEAICRNNNIWAKNTNTQEEIQLTKNMGAYGSHSFSQDGSKLVFIESDNCDKPINQKLCYKLMSIDFHKALIEPQSPSALVECKNSRIIRPKWLNNNNIALMQEFSNRWKLTSYSITKNESTVLYEQEDGNLIYFDYSANDNLIALTSIHGDGQKYIEILQPDGQILSSHKIELPQEIPADRFIYPNFTPYPNQLIFSTGRQLFTLSFEGKISNISLPLDEAMSSPTFHPSAARMLVIKGHYDSDIATMPLSEISLLKTGQNHSTLRNNYSVIERSIKGENFAQFQPNGELIAFRSNRSGKNQVWITDSTSTQQLSDFPIDTYSYELNWAADGKSILVNANNELIQVFVDSRAQTIPLALPVEKLFQWNSESNTALSIVRIKGVSKFAELNLRNAEYKILNDKKVTWAHRTEDGRLIYTDQMDQFWQSGPVEDQPIASLIDQGSDKRFVIKDNVIYGINEDFQLWSYALNDNRFEIIGYIPETIDYLTDINQTDILFTLRVAAKKEVAEIILAN